MPLLWVDTDMMLKIRVQIFINSSLKFGNMSDHYGFHRCLDPVLVGVKFFKLDMPLLPIGSIASVFLIANFQPQNRLMEEPAAYGKLGLANLLELREECLREFHFVDAYRSIKQR